MRRTNETYTIRVSSPLVRPGLEITTQVSKRYLVPTLTDLLNQVRDFNKQQSEKEDSPKA